MEALTSRSNCNLVVLVSVEGGKPENPEKPSKQQQTQPTREGENGNRTRGSQRWDWGERLFTAPTMFSIS